MSNNESITTGAIADMPNFVGRLVDNGHYQLTQVLGSGAYGVVYRAIDLSSPIISTTSLKRFAIKVLCKAKMSKRNKRNVRREISLHRVMADHPNVITMHRAFEDKDYVYIVLDFCPGGDLFGKICEERVYFKKDDLVKKQFLQLLDAVHACHRKRIFHRDLKPENILISEDGSKVYLSDFGLATSNQVSETFGCGSSCYMSPECIGKESGYLAYSNRASDIWALGVILVNMVTCRTPWQKAVTTDECFADFLLHEDFLREMLPISESANALFRRIFTYDPIERITISALRKAILELDTFFMSDEDIAIAPSAVRIAASYCGHKVAAPTPKKVERPRIVYPKAITTEQYFVIGSASSSEGSSASEESSSGSESDGPITPATLPHDPEIEIPFDIKLDDGEEVEGVKRQEPSKPTTLIAPQVPVSTL